MYKYFLFLAWMLLVFTGVAQPNQDSLWQVWNDPQHADSSRYASIFQIVEALEEPDSSLSMYRMIAERASEEDMPYWRAKALLGMTVLFDNWEEYDKGEETGQEGLAISETLNDDHLISRMQLILGQIYCLNGKWDLGTQMIKTGIQRLESSQDTLALAISYQDFAFLYHENSMWDTAIQLSMKALPLFRAKKNQGRENKILNGLGLAYEMLNIDDSALVYFQRSHDLSKELGDFDALANSQISPGMILLFNGEYDKGLQHFEYGLKICRENNIGKPQGWLLKGIGIIYFAQREHEQALTYYLQSLETLEAYPDDNLEIDLMDVIGMVYHRLEEHEEAEKYFEKGLALAQEDQNRFFTARFFSRKGLSSFQSGAYQESEEAYLSALDMYVSMRNIDGAANVQYRLARLYQQLEDWPKAIRFYEQSDELAQQIGNTPLLAAIGQSLHECYRANRQFEEALDAYQEYVQGRDSLYSKDHQRALLKYEFDTKALSDSLAFVQQKSASDLVFQQQIAQRNYLIFGSIAFAIIGLLIVRYRQQIRTREKEQELQRERERKEQLAELNQLKSHFFANISHELRTPLTLILGPLSHILNQPDAWEKESVQQQLTVMQRNGKSLMHLIEEILDLSRLEANKLELEEEKTDLTSFAKQVFANFVPQFEHRQIDASLHLNVREDLQILLDRKKTEKVLNNFLANALKFTAEGGSISLTIGESRDTLHFKVSDNGRGIQPEDLPYVFDRYFQSQIRNQAEGGTGIGLSLVKEIAHLMDGQTYAESTWGEGSIFFFDIPKKELMLRPPLPAIEKTKEILPAEPIYNIGGEYTIMVVEDNEDMRSFIHQLLKPMYQRVLLARNGAEGLALLKEHGRDIHLIVSDIMMPEVDGLSMLKKIKSQPDWNSIPVIMLTALASERDKLSALTIGVDDYLTKPFSVQELLVRVQNLLYNAHQRQAWFQSEEYLQGAESTREEAENELRISPADKAWIEQLEQLVKDSLATQKLNVDNLADGVHLSPRQMRRKLKGITGLSPAKFMKEIQLQLAREELEEGVVLSLADVAFKSGFEHQRTFSTAFKERFGKSPREYLKGHEEHLG
ncbi:MAG: tetratricopeptide repeat protein [Bacteroidota bacterium]